ncbi:FAD-dependent oxidoreductase [Bradyrhizobium stylosanthis]|uniref:Pyridine nucleotide-disulfide oxidoreductase n=1 Tax=Bradyrhizobium stylosanthis TaxID=1803665 RepID=A0A560E5K7_9BRAD|nr:FAD-dependent oxidoreductase [Bradyrhizobium stylosanthis]TWB04637.1 pyridine nucleotide-disulfide oxidoreductase [Bradyrhizobium stylosanthis]
MPDNVLEADYVVVGAGAAGMAFTDTLLHHGTSTVAIIDAGHAPGGHWNHSYPFVTLHLPSPHYGVESRVLGNASIIRGGLNDGLSSMASGPEIVSYYRDVMDHVFLPTGRVAYLPMTRIDWRGHAVSLVTGERRAVKARKKLVDATYAAVEVPSMHKRRFQAEEGVRCVPVNDLVRISGEAHRYCIIGGGKTGVDACLWLLENGADPDNIRWIVPRDSWWINRSKVQFTQDFFEPSFRYAADLVEAIGEASSIDDLFLQFEGRDLWLRLDRSITPTMFHGATVSKGELEKLRLIKDIVRRGHVRLIHRDRVDLEEGTVSANDDWLYVDCTAAGIPSRETKAIFEPDKITLQWVKWGRAVLSAAVLGYVEATIDDDDLKNDLCQPMSPPRTPADWLGTFVTTARNEKRWSSERNLAKWARSLRLDMSSRTASEVSPDDTERMALLWRARKASQAAVINATRLLAEL